MPPRRANTKRPGAKPAAKKRRGATPETKRRGATPETKRRGATSEAKRPRSVKALAKKRAAGAKVRPRGVGVSRSARQSRSTRSVYFFGGGRPEGNAALRNLLGGKGANLAEMAGLGLPVPPGFTITTEVCTYFTQHSGRYPKGLEGDVHRQLQRIEKEMGRRFGDHDAPLLISVRSGARASMPGMMDTVLNLGMNEQTIQGLIRSSGNPRFAYDSYRRFVQMYGDVVLDLKPVSKEEADPFEEILDHKKRSRGVKLDTELTAEDLRELVAEFKGVIHRRKGVVFPEDPYEQLWGAIGAVFRSWNNDRAITYRKLNQIPDSWGTAVNVQAMVFGNLGAESGTGVAFTRDPATGENAFYGEFLMNAQGEDVVAGTRTPLPIEALEREDKKSYAQLLKIRRTLERHYRDMMDIEFTIEKGRLYMLQCRVGKRTGAAAIHIATDMVQERLIKATEALARIEPEQLSHLLRPTFLPAEKARAIADQRLLTRGLNAGPGAATGQVYFNAEDAEAAAKRGEQVLLVRIETSPEDIRGMAAANGVITARGGMTSHAALVARQMGKVCVAGCESLLINYRERTLRVEGHDVVVREGENLSIDGSTGEVFLGRIGTEPSEVVRVLIDRTIDPANAPVYQRYARVMAWADRVRTLKVRANADQPDQSANAVAFGAEGIGLCRTEHMFFGEDKIGPMREMILSETEEQRRSALAKLLPLQRADFCEIFRAMAGRPVTIRTLDPPLHEFLPHDAAEQATLAAQMGISVERVRARIDSLHEFNPMLGFRGCRLGILHPEITEMQARAIFEAAVAVRREGIKVHPEVMIPLVGHAKELALQAAVVHRVAADVKKESGARFSYLVGTMIEVPRGALTADAVAETAEFFSFGTNDLTQMTLGVSRDDAGRFLAPYVNEFEIYPRDPFESIDEDGVGALIEIAISKGRRVRPDLKIGICGEHGGEPASVEFCHRVGLDYVSCSPFRLPVARLAAARAALAQRSG